MSEYKLKRAQWQNVSALLDLLKQATEQLQNLIVTLEIDPDELPVEKDEDLEFTDIPKVENTNDDSGRKEKG
uniref:Uncharacterized protein n=1 Tax=Candidatus Kentrum sp. TUN TaxID=2126343 RepID=A0A451AIS7_9GAMM|nr:MAG: hypothetical protein BECKTUN1418F_GA0071002_11187 [Candidatus Kentron sp. TUN]VFK65939.1 MAG: hypothetical protein BECKTUN1418E_GA0071001_11177 [Candidatus Kentron sp. TUN]